MQTPPMTYTVTRPAHPTLLGSLVQGDDAYDSSTNKHRSTYDTDKRTTMPRGGYRYGKSNPRLRPPIPKGA